MNDEYDLNMSDEFGGGEVTSFSQKHLAEINLDTRRHLEERLEASRLEKQTRDYDDDFDFD
jgi:hypothetical protein